MATKTEDKKIYEPTTEDETPLPEAVIWEEIVDRPTTLTELSIVDGARLDAAEAGLGDKSIQGWVFDGAFSASDNDTVAWASGTLRFKDGTSYSIAGGNTGNMATITYIYFDLAVSTTALQTTTVAANAVGANKLLMGVAQNVASGKKAIYQAFGGQGGVGVLLTADNIAANSITANEIQTNTITTLNLTAGTISGMTITGGTIQTATSGRRVKISSSPANKIEFYDDTTLYGVLEADKVGTDGYINLLAQDEGAGLSIYTGIGASAFSSVELFGNGGGFAASGNSGSNAFAGIFAGSGSANVQYSGGGASVSFYLDDGGGSEIGVSCIWRPDSDATYDIGTSSRRWRDGRFSRDVYVGDDIVYQGVEQGINYYGYVSGTSLTKANNSFSISNPSTGKYTITHNFNTTNYIVVATTLKGSGAGDHVCKIESLGTNDFKVTTFTANDGIVGASDFMFVLMKIS